MSPALSISGISSTSRTYDLRFGRAVANAVLGGWTIGTILITQSGTPTQMNGGYSTVNQNDAGIVFNGFTPGQLPSAVGVYRSGNPWVETVNRAMLTIGTNGAVSPAMTTPASTAGVWGYRPFIYGPHWFNDDPSLNKTMPVRESLRFRFQAQCLNGTNHATFSLGGLSLQFIGCCSPAETQRRGEFRRETL